MTNYIWITAQKEFTHSWKNAKDDVEFLKYEHRHLFKFKVWIQVFTDDRDIEFIQFKRFIESFLNNKLCDMSNTSCEMMSDAIAHVVSVKHPNRDIKIEVSEDGENGSEKFYPKEKNGN